MSKNDCPKVVIAQFSFKGANNDEVCITGIKNRYIYIVIIYYIWKHLDAAVAVESLIDALGTLSGRLFFFLFILNHSRDFGLYLTKILIEFCFEVTFKYFFQCKYFYLISLHWS